MVTSSNSVFTDLRSLLDLTNLINFLCTAFSNIDLNVGFEIGDVTAINLDSCSILIVSFAKCTFKILSQIVLDSKSYLKNFNELSSLLILKIFINKL